MRHLSFSAEFIISFDIAQWIAFTPLVSNLSSWHDSCVHNALELLPHARRRCTFARRVTWDSINGAKIDRRLNHN